LVYREIDTIHGLNMADGFHQHQSFGDWEMLF
jgi:hypothetical protein